MLSHLEVVDGFGAFQTSMNDTRREVVGYPGRPTSGFMYVDLFGEGASWCMCVCASWMVAVTFVRVGRGTAKVKRGGIFERQ